MSNEHIIPGDDNYQDALHYYHKGELTRAETLCNSIVDACPDNSRAWHLLGMIALRLNNNSAAIEFFNKSIHLQPDIPLYYNALAEALKRTGQYEIAETQLQKALALKADFPEAINTLGSIYLKQDRLDEAEACFHRCIEMRPDFAVSFLNLGAVRQSRGEWHESIALLNKALQLEPGNLSALFYLGCAMQNLGKLDEAINYFQRAVDIQPDFPECYLNIAVALYETGDLTGALSNYQRAVAIKPDFPEALNGMGYVYADLGDLEKAKAHYQAALDIDHDYLPAHRNLAYCLNCDPHATPEQIYGQHIRCGEQYTRRYTPNYTFHNTRDRDRTLRIGYVSADFRQHPVASFIRPIIANHDRNASTVYCYANSHHVDKITNAIKSDADVWRNIRDLDTEAACSLINEDRIDILVDLSGYTEGDRLDIFASKPAPVQATYLGYPNTTGISTIDYRITDLYSDSPAEAGQFYTEELVRLEKIFAPYSPPDAALDISELPALSSQQITLGSLHAPAKLNDAVLELWSAIIREIPGSRLVLYRDTFTDYTANRISNRLLNSGLCVEQFAIVSGNYYDSHMVIYNNIDISLDTFPWSSHTTTCESLWMGVPVVTMYGNTHASRMSASVIKALGLEELIARDRTGYIDATRKLAHDTGRLAELRSGLRDMFRKSPLLDYRNLVADLEKQYRAMWYKWLDR